MDIKQVILSLDPADDSLWTQDGLPQVGTVTDKLGSTVSRADISQAVPGYTREKAQQGLVDEAPEADVEDSTDESTEELMKRRDSLAADIQEAKKDLADLEDQIGRRIDKARSSANSPAEISRYLAGQMKAREAEVQRVKDRDKALEKLSKLGIDPAALAG